MTTGPTLDERIVDILAAIDPANRAAYAFARLDKAARAKGRPEAELTWGDCVRETGIPSSVI